MTLKITCVIIRIMKINFMSSVPLRKLNVNTLPKEFMKFIFIFLQAERRDPMETIKDADQRKLCMADPYNGTIVHTCRKDKIMICLPVGGEITFVKEKTCTVIRREGYSLLRVNSVHLNTS